MIDRIEYIRNFGIFNNFSWDSQSMNDFKSKNIIYGWNYSGKTTISRIFSSLKENTLHPDYPAGIFKLKCKSGDFDENRLDAFPYKVEVFNSDYVKENLRWEQDQNINAIAFEVGETVKLSKEIDNLLSVIEEINGGEKIIGKKAPLVQVVNEYRDFESSLFTIEARRIKDVEFLSLINFDKRGLKNYIPSSTDGLRLQIIASQKELNEVRKIVLMTEPKEKLSPISFTTRYSEYAPLLEAILLSVPEKADIIDLLERSNESYLWAKQGVAIHNVGDRCIFCNNEITEKRYHSLIQYFSNQASRLRDESEVVLKLLGLEEVYLNSLIIPYSENDLNSSFQADFKSLKSDFSKLLNRYKRSLRKYTAAIEDKITHSLYEKTVLSLDETSISALNGIVTSINDLISRNNAFSDSFDSIVETNREKYKAHLVASFLKNNKYFSKAKASEAAEKQLNDLEAQVVIHQNAINILRQRKESKTEGCAQLNSFVQSFLGRSDVEVRPNSDGKYNLMRGETLARNLSEGEKMAISFAHFLVLIKSLEQKGILKNYIIFIDDPISSLDNNHVFQINSLIKESFFIKASNNKWDTKCMQLFISTHNYDFFNLLTELPVSRGFENKESRYFISRNRSGGCIEKLPKAYDSYKSEYHYLFSEIHTFDKDPNKNTSPRLYLMPNILRRFLEMYTLTKYPSKDGVDERANIVFDSVTSKRILKPLHYHSHLNSIDRIGRHSDLLADISTACNAMLLHIKKKDKIHYDALKSSF